MDLDWFFTSSTFVTLPQHGQVMVPLLFQDLIGLVPFFSSKDILLPLIVGLKYNLFLLVLAICKP